MALLRGKLFAGALFAGALFGSVEETVAPQPEVSGGFYRPIAQRRAVRDAVSIGSVSIQVKGGRLVVREKFSATTGEAKLGVRSGSIESSIVRRSNIVSAEINASTGNIATALRLTDNIGQGSLTAKAHFTESWVTLGSQLSEARIAVRDGGIVSAVMLSDIVGRARVGVSTGTITSEVTLKPVIVIPLEPVPIVSLTTKDLVKAEKFARRVDKNLSRLLNADSL